MIAFLVAIIALAPGTLPDHRLTPGSTLPVTHKQVCSAGYSKMARKQLFPRTAVYRRYKLKNTPGAYEVDHLISIELGGSNDVTNLWPQSYSTVWNAHVKDQLENELHREVCHNRISLLTAQTEIRTNWVRSYQLHFHRSTPRPVKRK